MKKLLCECNVREFIGPMAKATPFLALVGALFSTVSFAASFRIVAGGGYEKMQIEKPDGAVNTPKPLTGYGLSAMAEVGFLDSIPGFSLLGGVGLRYASVTEKSDNVKTTWNPTTAVVEFGPEFSLIPLLRVQALATAEVHIAGEYETVYKPNEDSTKENEGLSTEKLKMKNFKKYGVTARVLYTVAPFVSIGLEPSYSLGSTTFESDGDDPSKVDFSSLGLKLVAAVTL